MTGVNEPAERFNGTELIIIRDIAEIGREVSAYELSKSQSRKYSTIFRYCKILETDGILISRPGIGEKKSPKTYYNLSLTGFLNYFYCHARPEWIAFGFPYDFSKYEHWFALNHDNELIDAWISKILKVFKSCEIFDQIFKIPDFIKNTPDSKKEIIIWLDIMIYISTQPVEEFDRSNPDYNQKEIIENIYNSFEDIALDIINQDGPASPSYMDVIHAFVKMPILGKIIEDSIYLEFQCLIDSLIRINDILPQKIEYIANLKRLDIKELLKGQF